MKKLVLIEILILILGGVFLWNTWAFGWLNHGTAGYTQMSISELNVPGQPYAAFFSITEGLSGACMLVSAAGLLVSIRKKNTFFLIALGLTAVLGVLTIFDATHPVDCNRYHNPTCIARAARGVISRTEEEHGIESDIMNYMTVALALVLMAWAFVHKALGEDVAVIELVAVTLLAIGVILSLIVHGDGVVFSSFIQRLWNVLVSFEFLYVAYKAWKLRSA